MRLDLVLLVVSALPALAHPAFTCQSCHVSSKPGEAIAICGRCHAHEQKSFATSAHAASKALNCATCHGAHAVATAKQIEQKCLACHPDSPEFFLNNQVACTNCHSPHSGE